MTAEEIYQKSSGFYDQLVSAEEWLQLANLTDDQKPCFKDPKNTWIDRRARIGRKTLVFPGCVIMGLTYIGNNCVLFPHTTVIDITTGDNVILGLPTMKYSEIGSGSVIGRTAEINNSTLGKKVKMVHHGYLGNTVVGDNSNIGASTVTANYDGTRKNITVLGPETFTGIHSSIIAPNVLPRGIYIAAGSVIPANLGHIRAVPPESLIISRTKEIVIKPRERK